MLRAVPYLCILSYLRFSNIWESCFPFHIILCYIKMDDLIININTDSITFFICSSSLKYSMITINTVIFNNPYHIFLLSFSGARKSPLRMSRYCSHILRSLIWVLATFSARPRPKNPRSCEAVQSPPRTHHHRTQCHRHRKRVRPNVRCDLYWPLASSRRRHGRHCPLPLITP